MPEIVTEQMRKLRGMAAKAAGLLERAERERLAADAGFAAYEDYVKRFGADSVNATMAYRQASYHRQAWAASAAEATALLLAGHFAGRA
jgi:hypothetical protein